MAYILLLTIFFKKLHHRHLTEFIINLVLDFFLVSTSSPSSPHLENFCHPIAPSSQLFQTTTFFPHSQFPSIQLERSNMPTWAQNSGTCKKFFDCFLSGREEKHVDICSYEYYQIEPIKSII